MPEILPLVPTVRAQWETLARGYHAFYEESFPSEAYDRTWKKLQDNDRLHALGAYVDGELVGIVHFLFHAHVWQEEVCYLQDLFVAEPFRRWGVGQLLVEHVAAEARRRGAFRVYWMTHESNARARGLYDRIAGHSGFIRYEYPIDSAG